MDKNLNNISAYILTGGQSRRFPNGKCFAKLNGKPLTEIIYDKLDRLFEDVYIVGKISNFPHYPFIQDNKPIQCPLNGIVSAIEESEYDWNFVISCDLPLINQSTIETLYNCIGKSTHPIIPNVEGRIQPLCAFYHKDFLNYSTKAIEIGEYSITKLLKKIQINEIKVPSREKEQFLNINYPHDLELAEKY